MPEFKLIEVTETPYLYIAKSSSMDPQEISKAMGEAFKEVWEFMQIQGIAPVGAALSVYYENHPDKLVFRSGFTISRDDIDKASGTIAADVIPAGEVLHFVHKGSYSTLRDDYGLMMEHIKDTGREISAPTWEVYLNDPGQVAEEDLLTEVFSTLK